MTVKTFDKGDVVVLSASFKDRNDNPIDPGVVTFKIKDPAEDETTFVFGVDSELVKDSVGNYHVDVPVNLDGYWRYKFQSTGVGQAAEERQFQIKRGFF